MNPFEDAGYVFVEVVEVGDEFDETQVNQRIPAAHDAAVDLFLANCSTQPRGKFGHDVVNAFIELIGQLFVHEILALFVYLPNVIIDHCHLL